METTTNTFLERLRAGHSEDGWGMMNDLYGRWLRGWLLFLEPALGTEADDVVQEAMIVVVRDLPSFQTRGKGSFRGWLKTIAVNCLRESRRGRRRRGVLPGPGETDLAAQLEDPHSELSQRWDREYDRNLIARMLERVKREGGNETYCRAFLRLAEGASAADVAEELGLAVPVVYLAKSRILHHLRALRDEYREFFV